MVKSKSELIILLKSNASLIKSYGVEAISLFGSFRHDKANMDSDVDLLVDFYPEKKSYKNLFLLYDFLQNLTGRKVEIITRQGLSKYLGPYILNDCEHVAL